jgi:hypothetical protein
MDKSKQDKKGETTDWEIDVTFHKCQARPFWIGSIWTETWKKWKKDSWKQEEESMLDRVSGKFKDAEACLTCLTNAEEASIAEE